MKRASCAYRARVRDTGTRPPSRNSAAGRRMRSIARQRRHLPASPYGHADHGAAVQRVLHHRQDVQSRPRALHRGPVLEWRRLDDAASDHIGDEGRASRRHLERRTHRDAEMPVKNRGSHRRGAARKAGEGRKTGKGSVRPGSDASSGKHRDSAPSGARDGAPRSFGSRKPKGSFGARDTKAHGFRGTEAGEPRSFEGRDKPRTSFGDRKPKGSFGRRDEKPRSQLDRAGARMRPSRRGMGARVTSMRASRATARSSRDRRASGHLNNVRARQTQPDAKPSPPLPEIATGVQTVTVSADESGMRLDRFFEARFPGLSFSHIQRIIRKGEVRVNGKRADPRIGSRSASRSASRRSSSMCRSARRSSRPRTRRPATFSSRSRCTRTTTCWC